MTEAAPTVRRQIVVEAPIEQAFTAFTERFGDFKPPEHNLLGALGDPTRRAILACLAERPRAVGELAEELPVSRPAVSQHLKVLKSAGLVTERAAGTRRIYRLNPAGVAALRDQLETFWNRALAGYQDLAEQPEQEKQP